MYSQIVAADSISWVLQSIPFLTPISTLYWCAVCSLYLKCIRSKTRLPAYVEISLYIKPSTPYQRLILAVFSSWLLNIFAIPWLGFCLCCTVLPRFFSVISKLSFDISVSSYRLFSNVSVPVLFVLIFLLTLSFYLTFTVSYCSLLFNCIPSATITLFIFIYPSPPSHFTPSCIFSYYFLVQCYKCPPLGADGDFSYAITYGKSYICKLSAWLSCLLVNSVYATLVKFRGDVPARVCRPLTRMVSVCFRFSAIYHQSLVTSFLVLFQSICHNKDIASSSQIQYVRPWSWLFRCACTVGPVPSHLGDYLCVPPCLGDRLSLLRNGSNYLGLFISFRPSAVRRPSFCPNPDSAHQVNSIFNWIYWSTLLPDYGLISIFVHHFRLGLSSPRPSSEDYSMQSQSCASCFTLLDRPVGWFDSWIFCEALASELCFACIVNVFVMYPSPC